MTRKRAAAALFEEMVEDPNRALRDVAFWKESVCHRWLGRVDDLAHEDLRAARGAGVIGVRLALRTARRRAERRITHRCVVALSLAVLGSTHRASGNLKRAAYWLEKANRLRSRCQDRNVHVEIDIRTAYLRLYQAQRQDGTFDRTVLGPAIHLADAAVGKAYGPVAVVRSLNARGTLFVYSGQFSHAAQDARAALDRVDPEDRPMDQTAALSLLVFALTSGGDESDVAEAKIHLQRLKGDLPHRMPACRGRLMWAEALLLIPDRRRKAPARRLLEQARRRFLWLGMKAEATAVTAEMARLKPEGAVPQLAAELMAILDPGPIRDLTEKLRTVRTVERVAVAEELRSLVTGPGVLPPAAFPLP